MIKSSIEKIAEDIGFDIGHSDNETQAKLLNGLCKALNQIQFSRGSKSDLDMQLAYIEGELEQNSRQIIIALAEFCKETMNQNTK